MALRLSLNVWGGFHNTLRVVLMGSENPLGIPRYQCEIGDERTNQVIHQEKGAKYIVINQDTIERIQGLLSDITITAAPQSFEGIPKGVNYMLKIDDVNQSASYIWRQQPPKGWERLQEIVDLMIGLASSFH